MDRFVVVCWGTETSGTAGSADARSEWSQELIYDVARRSLWALLLLVGGLVTWISDFAMIGDDADSRD